jgi:hypothetical protein
MLWTFATRFNNTSCSTVGNSAVNLFKVLPAVNGLLFIAEQLTIPSKVMDSVELVLEGDDHLVEQKRLPGENNVCCKN